MRVVLKTADTVSRHICNSKDSVILNRKQTRSGGMISAGESGTNVRCVEQGTDVCGILQKDLDRRRQGDASTGDDDESVRVRSMMVGRERDVVMNFTPRIMYVWGNSNSA